MGEYFKMGVSDVQMADFLKAQYDNNVYGLRYLTVFYILMPLNTDFQVFLSSVITIRRLRKQWDMKSMRQQRETEDTIYESVLAIRKQFPTRGNEGIRKTLQLEHGIHATR
jgi:hypothetical protein